MSITTFALPQCYLWTYCAFYFYHNKKCYIGRYSGTWGNLGTQGNGVKYYTRNDYRKSALDHFNTSVLVARDVTMFLLRKVNLRNSENAYNFMFHC